MGTSNFFEVDDDLLYFVDSIVSQHRKFDGKNLAFCKYLNLRHSSIDQLNAEYLILLEYVDIAFSNVKNVDLFDCLYLKNIVVDKSQKVVIEHNVVIEEIYDTTDLFNKELVSLGINVESTLDDQKLSFAENIITGYK